MEAKKRCGVGGDGGVNFLVNSRQGPESVPRRDLNLRWDYCAPAAGYFVQCEVGLAQESLPCLFCRAASIPFGRCSRNSGGCPEPGFSVPRKLTGQLLRTGQAAHPKLLTRGQADIMCFVH
jgi:hypothetical protein